MNEVTTVYDAGGRERGGGGGKKHGVDEVWEAMRGSRGRKTSGHEKAATGGEARRAIHPTTRTPSRARMCRMKLESMARASHSTPMKARYDHARKDPWRTIR